MSGSRLTFVPRSRAACAARLFSFPEPVGAAMVRVKPDEAYPGSTLRWGDLMTGYVAELVRVHGWAVVVEAEVRRGWHVRGAFPTAALAEGYVSGCWDPEERKGLAIVST